MERLINLWKANELGRWDFFILWWVAGITLGIVGVLIMLVLLLFPVSDAIKALLISGVQFVMLVIWYAYLSLKIGAKRLRHLGLSLWYLILMFIPIAQVFFIFYLIFAKGDKEPTRLIRQQQEQA